MMPHHHGFQTNNHHDDTMDDTVDELSERLLGEGAPAGADHSRFQEQQQQQQPRLQTGPPPQQKQQQQQQRVNYNFAPADTTATDYNHHDAPSRNYYAVSSHSNNQRHIHPQHAVVSITDVDDIVTSDPFVLDSNNNNNATSTAKKVMMMVTGRIMNKDNYFSGRRGNSSADEELQQQQQDVFLPSDEDDEDLTVSAQEPEYRDTLFAILFMVQLVIVAIVAFFWGVQAMSGNMQSSSGGAKSAAAEEENKQSSSSTTSYYGVLGICLLSSILSLGVAIVSLNTMTQHAAQLIQGSLIGCIVLLAVNTIALFASNGMSFFAWLWLIMLVVTCLYAKAVWYRIPFAASTLRTAIECLQVNGGIYVLAYIISSIALIWVLVWMTALVGITVHHYNNSGVTSGMSIFGILFLVLSYHWTSQVLKNILHVTVSGVVGTWWFDPQDASSLFSPAIQDSLKRATSYSFGSICLGSLLVAIIQALQSLARSARRSNRSCGLLLCIVECLLLYIQRVAKYFNKWALVYVALYGYDYMMSGLKVFELFQARGWNAIITDNLIHRTISMVSVVIGAIAGLFGMLTAHTTGWATTALIAEGVDQNGSHGLNVVFIVCFATGFSLAGILMSTVLSATDAVIVCLAEAPEPFEENHPNLASDMLQKWRAVYPDECCF